MKLSKWGEMLKRQGIVALVLTFMFTPNVVLADAGPSGSSVSDLAEMVKDLQKTVKNQNQKIYELENKLSTVKMMPSGQAGVVAMTDEEFDAKFGQSMKKQYAEASKWLKDLKFKGDLRLRYEGFGNHAGTGDTDRNRFRFRLRFGFEKQLDAPWDEEGNKDMTVGFYLASGSADDPTSTNQTFDSNFTGKPISIDRAWATYKPSWAKWGPISGVEVTAGKFANPFEQGSSKMVWDGDVRPEGIYEQINLHLYKDGDFNIDGYVLAGQFVLDESSSVPGDANLFAFQGGLGFQFATPLAKKPAKWLSAVSYYSFDDYDTDFGTGVSTTNTNLDINGDGKLDAGDFEVVELYNELKITPDNFLPVTSFLDLAKNVGSNGENSNAWALGAYLGSDKKQGEWKVGYEYRYIEADAVAATFNDSDLGDGFTDKKGHGFFGTYMLTDSLALGAAAYIVENISSVSQDNQQRRLQLDLVWKF